MGGNQMKLYLEDDNGTRIPVSTIESFEHGKVNCLLMQTSHTLRGVDKQMFCEEMEKEIGIKVVIVEPFITKIIGI